MSEFLTPDEIKENRRQEQDQRRRDALEEIEERKRQKAEALAAAQARQAEERAAVAERNRALLARVKVVRAAGEAAVIAYQARRDEVIGVLAAGEDVGAAVWLELATLAQKFEAHKSAVQRVNHEWEYKENPVLKPVS